MSGLQFLWSVVSSGVSRVSLLFFWVPTWPLIMEGSSTRVVGWDIVIRRVGTLGKWLGGLWGNVDSLRVGSYLGFWVPAWELRAKREIPKDSSLDRLATYSSSRENSPRQRVITPKPHLTLKSSIDAEI